MARREIWTGEGAFVKKNKKYSSGLKLLWLTERGPAVDRPVRPRGAEALLTLVTAALVLAVSAALLFGAREVRMKTPEGD